MTIAFLACTKERLITNGENPKEFANFKKTSINNLEDFISSIEHVGIVHNICMDSLKETLSTLNKEYNLPKNKIEYDNTITLKIE